MKYHVIASYPDGIDLEKDTVLFRIAKHVVGGEGFSEGGDLDILDGTRTLDWGLSLKEDAELLKKILLQAKIQGLEVTII